MSDERFIPGTSRITEIESFHRYLAAADLCHGKKVLDIACGEGYGSDILSSTALEVVGVDICRSAIAQAREKYVSDNLTFACGDAYSIPFLDETFDCVVSFETIEHLEKPDQLLAEIKRVLTPDGFLILSSPNKKAFDRRNHCEHGENIFHKKEMENAELIALIKQFFPNIAVYNQDSFFSSQITGQNSVMRYFVKDDKNKIIRHESLYQTQYSIVLAGSGDLPSLQSTSYLDAHFDEQFGYQPDDEAIVNQFGLHGKFEQITAELAEKSGQLEQLQEQEKSLGKTLADEKNAHQETHNRLYEVLIQLKQFQDQVAALSKSLDEEKNAHQNDRSRLTDSVHQIDLLRQQEAVLSEKLKAGENALEQANQKAGAMSSELENEKRGHQETHNRLYEALIQLKQFQDKVFALGKNLDEEKNAHQNDRSRLTDSVHQIDLLRQQEASLSEKLKAGENALEQANQKVGTMSTELENEKRAHQETHNRLYEVLIQLKQLQDKAVSFDQTLDGEKRAHQETHNRLYEALIQLKQFQDKVTSLSKSLDEERNNRQNDKERLSDTLHQIEILRQQEAALSEKLKAGETALEQANQIADDRNSELENEKRGHQETHNRLYEALIQLKQLQEQVDSLSKSLDNEKTAHQNDRSRLTDSVHQIDMLRERDSLLSDNLKAGKTALEQAGKELDFLRKTLSDKNIELHNAQDYLSTIESQYNVLCSTAASLRDDLDTTRQKLNSSELALQESREKLSSAETEISSLRGQITDQNSLNARIAELNRELTEEQARSQHFLALCKTLQAAWSLRVFGQFHVRRRFQAAVQALKQAGSWTAGKVKHLIFDNVRTAAQGLRENGRRTVHDFRLFLFHTWEKSLNWRFIPYDRQVPLIHSAYERLGTLLKDEQEYQDWQRRQKYDFYQKLKSGAGLVVPEDLPLTSIVIPVYNNLKFTLSCLHSIYSINSKAPFEVIVVDDCSRENYTVLHRHYPQVKLIRNQKNLGFLRTANRGAKEARGEYIVFLNNDTEVLPAWLDELATALYHHPEAGMIGSQLIHMRTGTLQESGNLICKDGAMMPLGRGVDPNHPEFTYFREVDFVSAASIIMRKKVFDEMNGFDLSYAPAYFEDPDLGLRLQKAGYHNYVMPLSRVLHYEMISYGNTLEGACEKNRQFFFARWKDYLARHALYDSLQDFANCRKFARERLLYIDAETPMADRGSGGMDAIFFMDYFLKRGLDVVFHGEYTASGTPKYTEILLRMGVECINQPHRKVWEYLEAAGWCFKWLFISRVYQAQCFDSLLKRFCSQAHYIFNTVDLHFIREKLEADLRNDPKLRRQAKWTKMFELAVAKNADATIVISQDEKRILEKEYGMTNVWHIPQARPIAGRKENARRKGAVFVGSAHPPNMDGLRYFHDEILPLLPSDFHLTIVGEALRDVMSQKPEYQDLLQCPQFNFVGFVQDLGDVFNTAQLSIAPLRYGAGTKGKVASSMSFGVPCVSTNFGVEGTGMIPGENIMLGRTPQEFADAIRQLCTDPVLWRKISDGGLEFLRSKYDPAQVAAEVDKIFDFIIEKYKRSPKKHGDWAETMALPKQEELDAVALE